MWWEYWPILLSVIALILAWSARRTFWSYGDSVGALLNSFGIALAVTAAVRNTTMRNESLHAS